MIYVGFRILVALLALGVAAPAAAEVYHLANVTPWAWGFTDEWGARWLINNTVEEASALTNSQLDRLSKPDECSALNRANLDHGGGPRELELPTYYHSRSQQRRASLHRLESVVRWQSRAFSNTQRSNAFTLLKRGGFLLADKMSSVIVDDYPDFKVDQSGCSRGSGSVQAPRQLTPLIWGFEGMSGSAGGGGGGGGSPSSDLKRGSDESDTPPRWKDDLYPLYPLYPLYLLSEVPAVPEPSTWAMMILGFAGIGFMAYRRRNGALHVA
jgi:hypothetical protein